MFKFKSMELDLFHKIKSDKQLDSKSIITFIKDRLNSITESFETIEETDKMLHAKGLISGTIKIVGMDIKVSAETEASSAKLKFDGKHYHGPFFWALWGCLMFIVLVLIVRFDFMGAIVGFIPIFAFSRIQKAFESKPKDLLEKVIRETDMEFS